MIFLLLSNIHLHTLSPYPPYPLSPFDGLFKIKQCMHTKCAPRLLNDGRDNDDDADDDDIVRRDKNKYLRYRRAMHIEMKRQIKIEEKKAYKINLRLPDPISFGDIVAFLQRKLMSSANCNRRLSHRQIH